MTRKQKRKSVHKVTSPRQEHAGKSRDHQTIREVNEALGKRDLHQLRQLSCVMGLVNHGLRERCWAVLCGAEDAPVTQAQYEQWAAAEHKDRHVVKVDVERSLFTFLDGCAEDELQTKREQLQRLLNAVVGRYCTYVDDDSPAPHPNGSVAVVSDPSLPTCASDGGSSTRPSPRGTPYSSVGGAGTADGGQAPVQRKRRTTGISCLGGGSRPATISPRASLDSEAPQMTIQHVSTGTTMRWSMAACLGGSSAPAVLMPAREMMDTLTPSSDTQAPCNSGQPSTASNPVYAGGQDTEDSQPAPVTGQLATPFAAAAIEDDTGQHARLGTDSQECTTPVADLHALRQAAEQQEAGCTAAEAAVDGLQPRAAEVHAPTEGHDSGSSDQTRSGAPGAPSDTSDSVGALRVNSLLLPLHSSEQQELNQDLSALPHEPHLSQQDALQQPFQSEEHQQQHQQQQQQQQQQPEELVPHCSQPLPPLPPDPPPAALSPGPRRRLVHQEVYYYQGLHDIASVLLLVCGSERAAFPLLSRLVACQLRDATRVALDPIMEVLDLLYPLVASADPALASHLQNNDLPPFFAVSWLITWFAHDVRSVRMAARLFDVFLSSHPLMPLYVGVAAMLGARNELIQITEMPELHTALVNLQISQYVDAAHSPHLPTPELSSALSITSNHSGVSDGGVSTTSSLRQGSGVHGPASGIDDLIAAALRLYHAHPPSKLVRTSKVLLTRSVLPAAELVDDRVWTVPAVPPDAGKLLRAPGAGKGRYSSGGGSGGGAVATVMRLMRQMTSRGRVNPGAGIAAAYRPLSAKASSTGGMHHSNGGARGGAHGRDSAGGTEEPRHGLGASMLGAISVTSIVALYLVAGLMYRMHGQTGQTDFRM